MGLTGQGQHHFRGAWGLPTACSNMGAWEAQQGVPCPSSPPQWSCPWGLHTGLHRGWGKDAIAKGAHRPAAPGSSPALSLSLAPHLGQPPPCLLSLLGRRSLPAHPQGTHSCPECPELCVPIGGSPLSGFRVPWPGMEPTPPSGFNLI